MSYTTWINKCCCGHLFLYRKHNVFFHIHLHRCRRLPLCLFLFSPVIIAYLCFLIHALSLSTIRTVRAMHSTFLSRSLSLYRSPALSCFFFFFVVDVVNNSETYLLFLRAFIVCVRAILCALKWRKRALIHTTRSKHTHSHSYTFCKNHKFIRNKLLSYSACFDKSIIIIFTVRVVHEWEIFGVFHQRIIPNTNVIFQSSMFTLNSIRAHFPDIYLL